ncbi:hypothetical protein Avbf_03103, partial [Armadillidium vulgare]
MGQNQPAEVNPVEPGPSGVEVDQLGNVVVEEEVVVFDRVIVEEEEEEGNVVGREERIETIENYIVKQNIYNWTLYTPTLAVELAPFGNIEIDGDKYPQDLSYSVSTVYCETPEE